MADVLFEIILLYWDLAQSVTTASTSARMTVLEGTTRLAEIKHILLSDWPVLHYFFGRDAELHIQHDVKCLWAHLSWTMVRVSVDKAAVVALRVKQSPGEGLIWGTETMFLSSGDSWLLVSAIVSLPLNIHTLGGDVVSSETAEMLILAWHCHQDKQVS